MSEVKDGYVVTRRSERLGRVPPPVEAGARALAAGFSFEYENDEFYRPDYWDTQAREVINASLMTPELRGEQLQAIGRLMTRAERDAIVSRAARKLGSPPALFEEDVRTVLTALLGEPPS